MPRGDHGAKSLTRVAVQVREAPIALARHPANQQAERFEGGDQCRIAYRRPSGWRIDFQTPQEGLRGRAPGGPTGICELTRAHRKTPHEGELAGSCARRGFIEVPDRILPKGSRGDIDI